MAVVSQGERRADPFSPRTQAPKPPECGRCRERKPGQIYVKSPNGAFLCMDCSSDSDRRALGECDPATCACGRTEVVEPDPA